MTPRESQLDNERLLDLMEGVTDGDAKSFDELCEAVRGILSATIFKVLNNREDSEDICQEVLAKVWEHGDLFDRSRGAATNVAPDPGEESSHRSVAQQTTSG